MKLLCLILLLGLVLPAAASDAADATTTPSTSYSVGASRDVSSILASADASFQSANFAASERFYREALAANPQTARAHWGLGRLHLLRFQQDAARREWTRALEIDPANPEVLRDLAALATNRSEEVDLLSRYVRTGSSAITGPARARLALLRKLGDRPLNQVVTIAEDHRIRLYPVSPTPAQAIGVAVQAEVNGHRLRLLLDTGAAGVFVASRAARKLGLEHLADSAVAGFGGQGLQDAQITLAEDFRVGSAIYRSVLVEVANATLPDGIDGILGPRLFEEFLLTLDLPRRELKLEPHPRGAAQDCPSSGTLIPTSQVGHLLLLHTRLQQGKEGYFLLDTGAARSAVSAEIAGLHAISANTPLMFQGMSGSMPILGRLPMAGFEWSGNRWVDRDCLVFSLDPLSRTHGVRIAGIVGYSLLRQSVVRIDYRDGIVSLAAR